MLNRLKRKNGHGPDHLFIICAALLAILGLAMLSSASSDLGKIKFNDTYYYLKHQVFYGLIPGILGFLFAFYFHYRHWQKLAFPILLVSLILLVLVFTPLGFSHGIASRWINLGPFSFQPAEFLKFSFIIYLAAWLSSRRTKSRQTSFLTGYLPFLTVSGLVAFLILIQPSTTTVAIIMAAGLIVYFAGGARMSYVALTIILGILVLALFIYLTPYRFARLTTFFNPESDSQEKGYHINQALTAIGSGGLFGVGFGKSTTKFKFLPEPIGDSIFAVIAEELGFVGAGVLLLTFAVLAIRGLVIAKKTRDQFARLTVVGLISVIAIQTFIHVAAISGLMPLTGVPLPFISYGGTSLAILLTMVGVVGNISKYT